MMHNSDNLYNINIERAVLSAILFDPYSADSENIISSLSAYDFYLPFHQHFYLTVAALIRDEKPVDEDFIREKMQRDGKFDEVMMLDIMASSPVSNVQAYVNDIKEKAQKRSLMSLATQIKKEIIDDNEKPPEVLERSISRMESIAESSAVKIGRKSMAYAVESAPEFICKDWLPIPKATLTLMVAPGGTGKTWLALQLAIRAAREDAGRRVFLWLSEDPEGTVKSRYETIIKDMLIGQRGTEDTRIDISTEDPMLLLESHGRSASISSRFYTMKRELREYDVIIIDPLLAFYGGDENDNSQARVFMQPFLNWARSENKSIIFLHHSRKGEGNNSSRARGAGAIVDAVRCVYDMDKIYVTKSGKQEIDPLSTHMRNMTLTKDNYGAIRYLQRYSVQRQITPEKSAPNYEVEESLSMPVM